PRTSSAVARPLARAEVEVEGPPAETPDHGYLPAAMRARILLLVFAATLVLVGGSARDAQSRSATCDGAYATINQVEAVASTSVTLTAFLHNQGCNVTFVFYLIGPN